MNDKTRAKILKLKAKGYTYKRIADELNISEGSVKSFLNRKIEICLFCYTPVIGKKYCSDKCRMAWWRAHPHKTKSMIECRCEECHKKFFAYPSKARKFCSKECYGKSKRGENYIEK